MDFMDGLGKVGALTLIVFALMFVVIMVVGSAQMLYYGPIARETAYNACIEKGYEYAEEFDVLPFSTIPLGIKCNYVSYEKRDIDVETTDPVPVVIG